MIFKNVNCKCAGRIRLHHKVYISVTQRLKEFIGSTILNTHRAYINMFEHRVDGFFKQQ